MKPPSPPPRSALSIALEALAFMLCLAGLIALILFWSAILGL